MPMTRKEEGAPTFEGWAILELMGHRRLAGYVREQEIAGAGFLRIDVPARDRKGDVATQFYAPGAVYALTPTTEELARRVAATAQPEPVTRWELAPPREPDRDRDDEDDDPLERP